MNNTIFSLLRVLCLSYILSGCFGSGAKFYGKEVSAENPKKDNIIGVGIKEKLENHIECKEVRLGDNIYSYNDRYKGPNSSEYFPQLDSGDRRRGFNYLESNFFEIFRRKYASSNIECLWSKYVKPYSSYWDLKNEKPSIKLFTVMSENSKASYTNLNENLINLMFKVIDRFIKYSNYNGDSKEKARDVYFKIELFRKESKDSNEKSRNELIDLLYAILVIDNEEFWIIQSKESQYAHKQTIENFTHGIIDKQGDFNTNLVVQEEKKESRNEFERLYNDKSIPMIDEEGFEDNFDQEEKEEKSVLNYKTKFIRKESKTVAESFKKAVRTETVEKVKKFTYKDKCYVKEEYKNNVCVYNLIMSKEDWDKSGVSTLKEALEKPESIAKVLTLLNRMPGCKMNKIRLANISYLKNCGLSLEEVAEVLNYALSCVRLVYNWL